MPGFALSSMMVPISIAVCSRVDAVRESCWITTRGTVPCMSTTRVALSFVSNFSLVSLGMSVSLHTCRPILHRKAANPFTQEDRRNGDVPQSLAHGT